METCGERIVIERRAGPDEQTLEITRETDGSVVVYVEGTQEASYCFTLTPKEMVEIYDLLDGALPVQNRVQNVDTLAGKD